MHLLGVCETRGDFQVRINLQWAMCGLFIAGKLKPSPQQTHKHTRSNWLFVASSRREFKVPSRFGVIVFIQ